MGCRTARLPLVSSLGRPVSTVAIARLGLGATLGVAVTSPRRRALITGSRLGRRLGPTASVFRAFLSAPFFTAGLRMAISEPATEHQPRAEWIRGEYLVGLCSTPAARQFSAATDTRSVQAITFHGAEAGRQGILVRDGLPALATASASSLLRSEERV